MRSSSLRLARRAGPAKQTPRYQFEAGCTLWWRGVQLTEHDNLRAEAEREARTEDGNAAHGGAGPADKGCIARATAPTEVRCWHGAAQNKPARKKQLKKQMTDLWSDPEYKKRRSQAIKDGMAKAKAARGGVVKYVRRT